MDFGLIISNSALMKRQAADEILRCNEFTEHFGLALTREQAAELVEVRSDILKQNDRIELGGGVIDMMIHEFCDSPNISASTYEETLRSLLEMFYYYKNETNDRISDEDLIKYMKKAFDGVCHGSLELLSGRELYNLARSLRMGKRYGE